MIHNHLDRRASQLQGLIRTNFSSLNLQLNWAFGVAFCFLLFALIFMCGSAGLGLLFGVRIVRGRRKLECCWSVSRGSRHYYPSWICCKETFVEIMETLRSRLVPSVYSFSDPVDVRSARQVKLISPSSRGALYTLFTAKSSASSVPSSRKVTMKTIQASTGLNGTSSTSLPAGWCFIT